MDDVYDSLQNLNAMAGDGGSERGSAKAAGRSDPHGDWGRALQKAEKQIKDLERELETASGKEARKTKQKIENIRKTAQRKKRGETHWK